MMVIYSDILGKLFHTVDDSQLSAEYGGVCGFD
jgi:hypothetical protein